jgi:hypothetical protein
MLVIRMQKPRLAIGVALVSLVALEALALGAGCLGPMGSTPTAPPKRAPVPILGIEIRSQPSSNPRPEFAATCQTGAVVRLEATGSTDPSGMPLVYEYQDSVDGALTSDFRPHSNPMQTTEVEVDTGLYTIGIHDIMLTIRAADGRKASLTLQVLVTSCESCGG